MIAIPGVVLAQNADDQAPDQDRNRRAEHPGAHARPNGQGSSIRFDGPRFDESRLDESGSAEPGPNTRPLGDPSYKHSGSGGKERCGAHQFDHGDVSTQRGDTSSWSARRSMLRCFGDRVSTGDKARTELQLDYANMLRLAEHTQANITQTHPLANSDSAWARHGELFRIQEQRCGRGDRYA